jgi:hypothetical protein
VVGLNFIPTQQLLGEETRRRSEYKEISKQDDLSQKWAEKSSNLEPVSPTPPEEEEIPTR